MTSETITSATTAAADTAVDTETAAAPEPEIVAEPAGRRRGRRERRRGAGWFVFRLLWRTTAVLVVLATVLAVTGVVSLRYVNPPTTSFMESDELPALYEWVDAEHIADVLWAAVVVGEDHDFPVRPGGADYGRTWDRFWHHWRTGDDAGGSTIQQQLAKNLVLWKGDNYVRKGVLELPLAELIARAMPRSRQVEIYVNVVEFGPGIWGVCAASWYYWRKPPSRLTPKDAATLVALLPNPKPYRAAKQKGIVPLPGPPGAETAPGDRLYKNRERVSRALRVVDVDAVVAAIFRDDTPLPDVDGASCDVMPDAIRQRLVEEGASTTSG